MKTNHLAVIWSSGDPEVAHKICFMYTHNAKRRGWFDHVTLIVWGPSAELLSRDIKLQERVRAMADDGVVLEACKACADLYGVTDDLTALGIDVKYMGVPLTEMLKEGWRVLTF
ncbi:MAG: DsrE family protein [Anaerolineae bacterium]